MANCKSCSAEIQWIRTETGRSAPINPKPYRHVIAPRRANSEPQKMYVFDKYHRTWYLNNTYAVAEDTVDGIEVDAYMPHFDVCPAAQQHRTKSRKKVAR